jgi:hypothetical protein
MVGTTDPSKEIGGSEKLSYEEAVQELKNIEFDKELISNDNATEVGKSRSYEGKKPVDWIGMEVDKIENKKNSKLSLLNGYRNEVTKLVEKYEKMGKLFEKIAKACKRAGVDADAMKDYAAGDSMGGMGGMSGPGGMLMTAGITLKAEGKPLQGALIILQNQSRTSNKNGYVEFEDVMIGKNELTIQYKGKEQQSVVDVQSEKTELVVSNNWQPILLSTSGIHSEQTQASNLLLSMITVLLCFGAAMVLIKKRHLLISGKSKKRKTRRGIIGAFLVLGIISTTALGYQISTLGTGRQAFAGAAMAADLAPSADPTLPMPANVKVYPDNESATVMWDEPANANAKNIVGYLVRWGTDLNNLTSYKQTIYTEAQIQPLVNGSNYTVTVQALRGKYVTNKVVNGLTYTGTFAEADGTYSPAVILKNVLPTSQRVDAMRKRLTGFFDDFELLAGNFNETLWNTAYTSCADPGENGAFINSQFHAHNQVRARSDYVQYDKNYPYCDRSATASRPRTLWDVTVGKDGVNPATETNPALIEMDLDGISRNRDKWYIDLIPVTARTMPNNAYMPVDLEGHNVFFQTDKNEPGAIFRIDQEKAVGDEFNLKMSYWDANFLPADAKPVSINCAHWSGTKSQLNGCGDWSQKTDYNGGVTEPPHSYAHSFNTVPNVRRHWVIEYVRKPVSGSPRIAVYIDGVFVMSAEVPAFVASQDKLEVFSELFAYTTGKDHSFDYPDVLPQTTLFHWDNFGFTGKPSTTVTHNYLDGGTTGDYPVYATGNASHVFPKGNRETIIPVPDTIGNPSAVRLMFSLAPLGNYAYSWTSAQKIILGSGTSVKSYPFTNPKTQFPGPAPETFADAYTPFSTGIIIDPADIKNLIVNGQLAVDFQLDTDVTNVHLEIDYPKGTQPAYTQPQNVFKTINFNSVIIPQMRWSDSYLFVEQDLGLKINAGLPAPPTHCPQSKPAFAHGNTSHEMKSKNEQCKNNSRNRCAEFCKERSAPL